MLVSLAEVVSGFIGKKISKHYGNSVALCLRCVSCYVQVIRLRTIKV